MASAGTLYRTAYRLVPAHFYPCAYTFCICPCVHSPVKDTVVTNDRWGAGTTCRHGGYFTCHDRYNPGKLHDMIYVHY